MSQNVPVTQSPSDTQLALQVVAFAHSRLPAQGSTGRVSQTPPPVQRGRGVSVLPLHFESPQAMPDGASAQLLMPLQAPVRPQTLLVSAAHSLSGSLPTGTARHWPSTPPLFEADARLAAALAGGVAADAVGTEAALALGRRAAGCAVRTATCRARRRAAARSAMSMPLSAACHRAPPPVPPLPRHAAARRHRLPPAAVLPPCRRPIRPRRRCRWRRRSPCPRRRRSRRAGCPVMSTDEHASAHQRGDRQQGQRHRFHVIILCKISYFVYRTLNARRRVSVSRVSRSPSCLNVRTLIVGAGISGLAAAAFSRDPDYLILEADRGDRRLLQDHPARRLRLGLLRPLLPLQAPGDRGLAARSACPARTSAPS